MAYHLPAKLIYLVCTCCLLGCEKPQMPVSTLNQLQTKVAVDQLEEFAVAQNQTAIIFGERLKLLTRAFLETPNEQTQLAMQEAWRPAHEAYIGSQIGLFMDSEQKSTLVFALDSWPIQPGFLDSLPEYPESGIINDITIDINIETIRHQHGITDREEVCLGYHAIEYLIFMRAVGDFVITEPSTESPQYRRRQLLDIVVTELNRDLTAVADKIPLQFHFEANQSSPNHILLAFLSSTRGYLQLAFRDSDHFWNQGIPSTTGHGRFSNTPIESLAVQLISLKQFTLDRVNFTTIFRLLDATSANNYQTTLVNAIALINDTEADEIKRSRLPLILSALLNQLEAFELVLHRQLNLGARTTRLSIKPGAKQGPDPLQPLHHRVV